MEAWVSNRKTELLKLAGGVLQQLYKEGFFLYLLILLGGVN